jgi:hypothetical protein
MQIMRWSIASILILVLCFGIVQAADTGYPTGDVLRDYAMQKNSPAVVLDTTVKLRSALESHVSEFISETRWAPYHEWFGIKASSVSMTEPADVFYSLSLAYPYLSGNLQQQVTTYLRNEWSSSQPYNNIDYQTLQGGTARNWHRIDSDDYNLAIAAGHPVSGRLVQIYPIYLFAQNTNSWDLVSAQYNQIKTIYNNIPSELGSRDDGNNNRNIASVIGFIRIAYRLGYSVDVIAALNKLETMLQTKIDHQRQEGHDCLSVINSGITRQWNSGGCLYTGRQHDGIITMFYGMVPELGRILRDYAETASNNMENWVNRNAQGFWLVNGDTPVQEGEVNKPEYITTMSYFHLMSDIQVVDFHRHRQLVDMPACHADVYFIERLVRAIEASAPQYWTDFSIPIPVRPPLNLRIITLR